MSTFLNLSSEDKAFFALVKQAIITNPFSRERLNLDKRIAGGTDSRSSTHNIEETIRVVDSRIQKIEKNRNTIIKQYKGEDRHLLEIAIQFLFFYRFRKEFDRFIHEQMEKGDDPVKLDFMDKVYQFFIPKGFDEPGIRIAIEHSFQFRRAFHFIDRSLIGRAPVMQRLRYDLWNNIFTHNVDLYSRFLLYRMEDFSTLILGETGSGKGTVASAIGRSGYIPFDMRKECFVESFMQSFVSTNLSQFPETLIESELFGHKKGAFTGAIEDYRGVLGRCSQHGAIFLDEIGEISQPVQVKLLHVLQDRIFFPVGSRQKERFQGRVIAATNRSIDDLRKNHVFRDDFYYRLCSDIIKVPSLRQRIREDPAELDDLLEFIVGRMMGKDSTELVEMVQESIRKELGDEYPWYGNVRELEQCVRRVILKKEYKGDDRLQNADEESSLSSSMESGDLTATELLSGYCRKLYDRFGTFEEVARRTKLDRRTVTKYIKNVQQQ